MVVQLSHIAEKAKIGYMRVLEFEEIIGDPEIIHSQNLGCKHRKLMISCTSSLSSRNVSFVEA